MKKTFAIETSCDDTSLAIVTYDGHEFTCEQMLSFSQIDLHDPYGGVVPELAYRSHADKIVRMLEEMKIDHSTIDFISVTSHPGLPGSLVVGVTTAHMLGQLWDIPVREVNHIMGHVFSVLLDRSLDDLNMPYLCLTVSGGHNDMYVVEKKEKRIENRESGDKNQEEIVSHGAKGNEFEVESLATEKSVLSHNASTGSVGQKEVNQPKPKRNHLAIGESLQVGPYRVTKIAQTLDDAAGEVYDKVSRMLGGPYPGGYWMDCQAAEGRPDDRVDLRVHTMHDKPLQFSYSGVKSQVYNLLRNFEREGVQLDEQLRKNIAWKFQEVTTDSLVNHVVQASQQYECGSIGVVGGVSANRVLRTKITQASAEGVVGQQVLIPTSMKYCTDNAAMIGVMGILTIYQ